LTGQRSASIGAGVKDNRRIARTLLRLAAGPGSDRVSVAELLRAFGPHAPAVLTLLFAERAADATGHIGDPRYPVAVHDGDSSRWARRPGSRARSVTARCRRRRSDRRCVASRPG
jgi:hypothetical protein